MQLLRTAASFLRIYLYAVAIVACMFFIFGISAFSKINYEVQEVVCAASDDPAISTLVEGYRARHADSTFRIIDIDYEYCDGSATNLIARYRSNPISNFITQNSLRNLNSGIEVPYSRLQMQPDRSYLSLLASLLITALATVFLVWQRRVGRYVQRPASPERPLVHIGYGLASAGLLFASVQIVANLVNIEFTLPQWGVVNLRELSVGPVEIFIIVMLMPLIEEIVFRAWLLEAWRKVIGPGAALMLSSVMFSLIHPMGVVENLIFLLPGILLGLLWLRTRSLPACCIAHGGYNALVIWAIYSLQASG